MANSRFTPIHMLQTVAQCGGSEEHYWAPNTNYHTVKQLYLRERSEQSIVQIHFSEQNHRTMTSYWDAM
jgi:hypothetical protein